MAKRFDSVSTRTKRENIKGHYRIVTRNEKNKIISNKAWHPPIEFKDEGSYRYIIKAKNENGEVRNLAIFSNKRYRLENRFQRRELREAIKKKYEETDDWKSKRYRFSISSMKIMFSKNQLTGQRWWL